MRPSLPTLRLLLGSLATLCLVACTAENSPTPASDEINTLNIYFDNNQIYSFNDDTGISTQHASYDELIPEADKAEYVNVIELNTDDDKQGFELAAYIYKNSLYILDYDKDKGAKRTELASVDGKICGIFPQLMPSSAAYDDQISSNRSTMHQASIVIAIKRDESESMCTTKEDNFDLVDFSNLLDDDTRNDSSENVIRTAIKAESFLGALVTDFTSSRETPRVFGFLGYSIEDQKVAFSHNRNESVQTWSTPLTYTDTPPTAWTASKNHTLVQQDEKLFVINTTNLFAADETTDSTNGPIQNRIDDLFSEHTHLLDSSSEISINPTQNTNSFIINSDNALQLFANGEFSPIPTNEETPKKADLKSTVDLTSDGSVVVIRDIEAEKQSLSTISTASHQQTTQLIEAKKIELSIQDSEFFVNTLNLNGEPGWQAHWFRKVNDNYVHTSYPNSRLIFINDAREKNDTILILASESAIAEDPLNTPSIYKFNKNEDNGRQKAKNSGNQLVDFALGDLSINVSSIAQSKIVNDIYGMLEFESIETEDGVEAQTELYFFNPSQETPNIDDQSLKLILRKL